MSQNVSPNLIGSSPGTANQHSVRTLMSSFISILLKGHIRKKRFQIIFGDILFKFE